MRYKLTVAYDGSSFHGWQKQEPQGQEPLRTVQGELEGTLVRVLRQPREVLALLGASRTDAGVHAKGQVCHFNADTPIPIERLGMAINSRLVSEIDVRKVEEVHENFDAIADVESKQYRYRIFNTKPRPLGLRDQVYHCWDELDLDRMNDAARRLVGTHDVEGFAAASHGRATTVRTIFDCRVEEHPLDVTVADPTGLNDNPNFNRELHVVISGSGFLYNMVRIIAGTLVEVGIGRYEPDVIDKVLASKNRRDAGQTLPPMGLCLEWIRYKDVPVVQEDPRKS